MGGRKGVGLLSSMEWKDKREWTKIETHKHKLLLVLFCWVFFFLRGSNSGTDTQRSWGVSIPGDTQNTTKQGLGQSTFADLAL